MSATAVVAPPVKPVAPQKAVSPEAVRVVFSPLVNMIVNDHRTIPFGVIANVPPSEYWASIRDIPRQQRIKVSPDPADPSTWPQGLQSGQLPKPTLACALTPSDVVLERLLKDYVGDGAVELVSLRDASTGVLVELNDQLGGAPLRTHAETVAALTRYRTEVLPHYTGVLGTALSKAVDDLERAANNALQIARNHWQRRKIEILRAANGDKEFTNHPDDYDLRLCEYAGINPTQTEADQLRAEILRQQLDGVQSDTLRGTTLSTDEIVELATKAGASAGAAAAVEVGKVIGHEIAKAVKPQTASKQNNKPAANQG